ncbi:MAG: ATP-binding protein [Roseofilum sp. SBFL]|uniref:DUF6272 family protein n=1 Tax=unclassified Roseofilum TaxID=2620099 RepID=UPI001B08F529|nr:MULTISPECIES: DUF6272 family protein [unclassified Roseofilum]MBP0015115.1 ATP-binding protein [Roseofilum sp. SID3]MBP0023880.1 ATP-binding protein [Roseofilum sp. SID2]MBP0039319.1 ATP-binding protein [Roseofilum sp. SID1]MBP0043459.1 ATP-binding protein [Roseofilum sp. SBFL]
MAETFGDYIDDLPESPEYLIIGFSPSSVPLKQRWRNNGLSADFLADYLTTFFPAKDDISEQQQAEVKSAVSYIANELLENAMKFNDETSEFPISIRLQVREDKIIFTTSNSIPRQKVNKFQTFLKKIEQGDPQTLYLEQLESSAQEESSSNSGLGLLTMLNDYFAKLGWNFETVPDHPGVIKVTTMVQLPI